MGDKRVIKPIFIRDRIKLENLQYCHQHNFELSLISCKLQCLGWWSHVRYCFETHE